MTEPPGPRPGRRGSARRRRGVGRAHAAAPRPGARPRPDGALSLRRQPGGPARRRRGDGQILGLLIAAGFTPDRARPVYRAYSGLLHGHVLDELPEVVVDLQATDVLLRLGLDRLPAQEFPHIRGLAGAMLAGYDGAVELDVLLDILLDGLSTDRAGER